MQSGDWRLWARLFWSIWWIALPLCTAEPSIEIVLASAEEPDAVAHMLANTIDFDEPLIEAGGAALIRHILPPDHPLPVQVLIGSNQHHRPLNNSTLQRRLQFDFCDADPIQWESTPQGAPCFKAYSDGSYESWSYNVAGLPLRHEQRNGLVVEADYDEQGHLVALRVSEIWGHQSHPLDPVCLWTWQDVWETVKEAVKDFLKGLYHQFLNAPQHCLEDLASLSLDRSDLESLLSELIGAGVFDYLSGYHRETLAMGTVGRGEISDKVRVTCINGILSHRENAISYAHKLSEYHGGVNTHYVYWPTAGWTWDMTRCLLVRGLSYPTEACMALLQRWRTLIEEMGGVGHGGVIYHYAHSVGAAESMTALSMLSVEERKMLRLVTFGSPYLGEADHLIASTHYISVRDGVPFFDPIALYGAHLDCPPHIVFLGRWTDGAPLIDHLIDGQTYDAILRELGNQFVEIYGSI